MDKNPSYPSCRESPKFSEFIGAKLLQSAAVIDIFLNTFPIDLIITYSYVHYLHDFEDPIKYSSIMFFQFFLVCNIFPWLLF